MTKPMNNIRVHDYPTLEDGNVDFPGAEYEIGHYHCTDKIDQPGMILEHFLTGAQLISDMLQCKKAKYACAISSPKSAHRELHVSSTPEQELRWDIKNYVEPPYFTPMILIVEEFDLKLMPSKHEVHMLWDQAQVKFPKGARLAVHSPFRLAAPHLSGMIDFVADETMELGQLKAKADAGMEFVFKISCHPDFLKQFQHTIGDQISPENVSPLAVAACLSILQNQYTSDDEEEGWRAYHNLRQLKQFLEDKDCGHWSDTDFNPLEVATALYPYRWSLSGDIDV